MDCHRQFLSERLKPIGLSVTMLNARLNTFSIAFVLLGVLALVGTTFSFLSPKNNPVSLFKTGLTERDIAINSARKNNQTGYSFQTHFIPSIGYVADPQAYLKQWQQSQPAGQ
jgi:hypothetical protein